MMCLFASQPEAGSPCATGYSPEDSIVVVVSPLKALMREQVEALKGTRRGSRTVCVGDALC